MKTVLFDDNICQNFFPITYSRPFGTVRTGIFTQVEKAQQLFGNDIQFLPLPNLREFHSLFSIINLSSVIETEKYVFINSRIRRYEHLLPAIDELRESGDALIDSEKNILVMVITGSEFKNTVQSDSFDMNIYLKSYSVIDVDLYTHTWQIVLEHQTHFEKESNDFVRSNLIQNQMNEWKSNLIGSDPVYISNSAVIHPTVGFDTRKGPIIIDDEAEVMAQSTLCGPLYIGKKSIVKIGAKIYPNTIIGPVCKVGGEIEDVVIQGYSNKQHEGFLGHAFLGEWVNLGADTNNSDLKNTYANVDIWENGKYVSTGSQFMGCIIGDHSKTAINTQLNTGTVIGFSSNVFGSGFPDRFIPSFHWSSDGRLIPYRMNKAIETAKMVLERRQQSFTHSHISLFEKIKQIAESVEKPN